MDPRLRAGRGYHADPAASPSSASPSSSNAAGKPRSVSRGSPRRTCSLGASPLHHQPTGKNLFRDRPEKLSAKLYETDLRKRARPDAQRDSRG